MKQGHYNLFLDDVRDEHPATFCPILHEEGQFRGNRNTLYITRPWVIVKNFNEFRDTIEQRGVPTMISFDHDLSEEHYSRDFTQNQSTNYLYEIPRGTTHVDINGNYWSGNFRGWPQNRQLIKGHVCNSYRR